MKNLEEQMGVYAACHQDARNKATHFVGVPLIMLAILVPLFEGRKPALVDNLFQIFVAPIFLAAEVLFALGLSSSGRTAPRAPSS